MSITTEVNRTAELVTDGAETGFDFSMHIDAATEVQVYFKATGGSYALLTLNTDYGVVFTESGGTVSTNGFTSPLVAGTLVIIRRIDITMLTNWIYLDNHSEVQHQDDFDRTVMRDLWLQELLERTPKFKISSTTTDIDFPEPVAGKVIGWDAAATNLENKNPVAVGAATAFGDLSDVDVDSPTIGDMVQWNGSSWSKVSNVSMAYLEIVKSGNTPGDNGNCRFIISGSKLIIEARIGGSWTATGWKHTIA